VRRRRASAPRAHVSFGNEKGGSGKSTTALHIAVALMGEGSRVATLDLDARQGTLSRYIENRAAYANRKGIDLAMPIHAAVPPRPCRTRRGKPTRRRASRQRWSRRSRLPIS
jgi:chromosome partitioning protein